MARLRTCKGLSVLVALALVLALGALALVLAPAMVVNAATIQVTNNNDGGPGSLRQAIADAIAGEDITFADNVTGTITLTTGQLSISKNLTITGPDADILTISGNNASRVFYVGVGATVTISGLTIANGYTDGSGGGICNNDGTVALNNCTMSGNNAYWNGGGIYNNGTVVLNNCTVSDNTAYIGDGGGISNDGGTATLTNCTISGNAAGWGGGGGIYNANGTVTLNNSTVSDNTAGGGGGIYNVGGTVKVKNTIVAGNNAAVGPDCFGTLTSYGCNLVEDTSDCTISGDETCNIYGEDPLLGPLQDNSGPTFTHALLEGSPEIDAVCTDCGCTTIDGQQVTTDQRGEPRPADGDDDGTALCDIGAYELQLPPTQPAPPAVPTVNHWGIAAMIALFAGLLVWTVRRRRATSRVSG
jgi:hypothetical protein